MLRPPHELTVVRFACGKCGVRGATELLNLHTYRVPGYSEIAVDGIVCWCNDCEEVVLAEHLPEINYYRNHPDGFSDDYLAAISELRRKRQSPPRCLSCGSVDFTAIDLLKEDQELARHRDCDGAIVCTRVGGLVHVFGQGERYTTDGELETKQAEQGVEPDA